MADRGGSSNRTWAVLAGAAALLLVMVFVALQPAPPPIRESRPSTFFSNDTGAKGGFLVLKEIFGEDVLRWRRAPSLLNLLDDSEAVASLIVMDPSESLTTRQAEALDQWMSEGGQLIVATGRPWLVRQSPRSSESADETESDEGESETAPEEEPFGEEAEPTESPEDYLQRHGFGILAVEGEGDPDAPLYVEGGRVAEGGHEVLAASSDGALAAQRIVGEGRLVVVPDPLVFSNQRLRGHPRNMTFLVRLLDDAPTLGRIAVDEYHHGFEGRRPFMAVLRGFMLSAWGLASLQLGAAGLLYLLGTRRRFGAVLQPPPAPVRDPVALVEARAGLLHTAEARTLAVELIDRHSRRRRAAAHPGSAAPPLDPEYQRILRDAETGVRLRDSDLPVFARIAEESARRQN